MLAAGAGGVPSAVTAAAGGFVILIRQTPGRVCELWSFLCERQQRLSLGATETSLGVFPQEKDDEGKDEAETDGQGERDDRHGDQFWPEAGARAGVDLRGRRAAG